VGGLEAPARAFLFAAPSFALAGFLRALANAICVRGPFRGADDHAEAVEIEGLALGGRDCDVTDTPCLAH
jgi:hypothetical protein